MKPCDPGGHRAELGDLVGAGGDEPVEPDQPVDRLADDRPVLRRHLRRGAARRRRLRALVGHRAGGRAERVGGLEPAGDEALQLARALPHPLRRVGQRQRRGAERIGHPGQRGHLLADLLDRAEQRPAQLGDVDRRRDLVAQRGQRR